MLKKTVVISDKAYKLLDEKVIFDYLLSGIQVEISKIVCSKN